jgi:hypothetical protein
VSIAFAMLLIGSLLVYCGIKNISIGAALRGDNTVARPQITQSGAGQVTK